MIAELGPGPSPSSASRRSSATTGAEARLEELPTDDADRAGAADAVGCTLGQIVKSLVLVCDGTPVVALVPGDRRADTGKVARLVEARRVDGRDRRRRSSRRRGSSPGGVVAVPARARAGRPRRANAAPAPRRSGRAAGSERHLVALAPAELVRLTRGRVEDIVVESP